MSQQFHQVCEHVQLPGETMLLLADAISSSLRWHLSPCTTADSQDYAAAMQSAVSAAGDPHAASLALLLPAQGRDHSSRRLVMSDAWIQHQPAMGRMLHAAVHAEPEAAALRAATVLANLPIEGVLWSR